MKIAAARPFIEVLPAGRAQTLAVLPAEIFIGKLKQDIRTEKLVQIQQIPFPHQEYISPSSSCSRERASSWEKRKSYCRLVGAAHLSHGASYAKETSASSRTQPAKAVTAPLAEIGVTNG